MHSCCVISDNASRWIFREEKFLRQSYIEGKRIKNNHIWTKFLSSAKHFFPVRIIASYM